MTSDYRKLTEREIEVLRLQGCMAESWERILVKEGFSPDNIAHVRFYGNIRLGIYDKLHDYGGIKRKAGVRNAELHDVTVGDNVLLENIGSYISAYDIADDAYISDVGYISMTGASSFGIGTRVAVLCEGTEMFELPLHDKLTGHEFYFRYMYAEGRIDSACNIPAYIDRLVENRVAAVTSDRGYIGKASTVVHTRMIEDVWIGDEAEVRGAEALRNCFLCSASVGKVRVGAGAICRNVVIQAGADVYDEAKVTDCLVGQCVHIGKGFSAESSLFFANSYMDNGEACAICAGPYTVSHHKATLLIGGMFSFMNAGSGTNMSNHMYKLGPLHYGVMKRGCKTASGAHLVWPARIGAFSMVMGKVDAHVDLDAYPFSYVFGNDRSVQLVPGVNFASVGTYRDVRKWEARDKRKPCDGMLDYISTYSELNPYIISKIVKGRKKLEMLRRSQGDCNEYRDGNIVISRKALERGICLYNKIEQLYVVLSAVALSGFKKVPEKKYTEWVDMLGLIVPQEYVMDLCHDMEEEKITSVDDLCVYWKKWKEDYPLLLKQTIECHYTLDRVVEALMNYESNIHCYYEALYADIRKEEELGDASLSRISSGFVEMLQHDCDEQLKKAKERLSSLLKELK